MPGDLNHGSCVTGAKVQYQVQILLPLLENKKRISKIKSNLSAYIGHHSIILRTDYWSRYNTSLFLISLMRTLNSIPLISVSLGSLRLAILHDEH